MPQALNVKNKTASPKVTVQPKLEINSPGDSYEQEADAMAEKVMRIFPAGSPPDGRGSATVAPGMIGRSVQRKCAHCEQEEKKKPLMRKSESTGGIGASAGTTRLGADGGLQAPSSLVSALNQTLGAGIPLPSGTRSFMENAFSSDFSRVRVHTGGQASEMSKGIHAKAFTYGSDIYFKGGQFNPENKEGKKLLAHELTHVVQQSGVQGGTNLIQRQYDPHDRGYAGEQSIAFSHYQEKDGWAIIRGPSGSEGHGVTTSGEDFLAYNVRTKELAVGDNKAFQRASNVQGATAIDPEVNLENNLGSMIQFVEGKSVAELPYRQNVLRLLRQTRASLRAGLPIPGRVKLIVSNAYGKSTGVSARLRGLGVTFQDSNQPPLVRPGTKTPQLTGTAPVTNNAPPAGSNPGGSSSGGASDSGGGPVTTGKPPAIDPGTLNGQKAGGLTAESDIPAATPKIPIEAVTEAGQRFSRAPRFQAAAGTFIDIVGGIIIELVVSKYLNTIYESKFRQRLLDLEPEITERKNAAYHAAQITPDLLKKGNLYYNVQLLVKSITAIPVAGVGTKAFPTAPDPSVISVNISPGDFNHVGELKTTARLLAPLHAVYVTEISQVITYSEDVTPDRTGSGVLK